MSYFLKKQFVVIVLLIIGFAVNAQQKQLGDEQYFKGNFKAITQTLPNATRWLDNDHFLLIRDGKTYVVDAKTGTERESTQEDMKNNAAIKKAAAYFKNNDLFIKDADV